MTWLDAAPAVFATLFVLFAPGLLAGLVLRARGFVLFAFAPIVSLACLGLFSCVLPLFGLYWRPLLVVPLLLLVSASVAFALSRLGISFAPGTEIDDAANNRRRFSPAILAAILLPTVTFSAMFIAGVPTPDRVSTVFDVVFHLNGVRYVTDTLNYSPFSFGRMVNLGDYYYQDLWHLLVSLTQQISGVSIPVATNSVILATLLTIWPVGVIFLVRYTIGGTNLTLVTAGVVASLLPSFPLGLVIYGPVYTNYLSYLFLPVCFTVMFHAVIADKQKLLANRRSGYFSAVLVVLVTSLAHPSAFIVALFFGVFIVLANLVLNYHALENKAFLANLSAGLLMLGALAIIYPHLASQTSRGDDSTLPQAISDAFNLSYFSAGKEWLLAVFALLALGYGVWRRQQVLVAFGTGAVFFSVLLVASVTSFNGPLVYLASIWHGDQPRFSAIIGVFVVPLATLGFVRVFGFLCGQQKILAFVFTGLVLVCAIFGMNTGAITDISDRYVLPTEETRLSSANKLKILTDVTRFVPPGQRILADPATGGSLSYMWFGYKSLKLYQKAELTDDEQIVWDRFSQAATDPTVCPAITKLGIYYAVYFPGDRLNGEFFRPHGLDGILTAPGMELVSQAGEDRLYRVTACG